MIDIDNPPKELKNWIKRAKRCFTECPSGIWFYVADSELHIMACNEDGGRIMDCEGGVNSEYIINSIQIADIDGGGW